MDELKRIRICLTCGLIDIEVKFKSDGHGRLSNQCKRCDAKQSQIYRIKNPEKYKEQQRKWREANEEKRHTQTKQWGKNNPNKIKANSRRAYLRRYNITEEIFAHMLEKQDNKCAICMTEFKNQGSHKGLYYTTHIDHNHLCCPASCKSCGKCIRGLLCGPCNQYLGRIKDRIESAQRAVDYLKRGK